MTEQEIFDTVSKHLLRQNARASDDSGQACFYRAPNGLQCAFGCLIPDELYDPLMEGYGASRLFSCFPELTDYIGAENEGLIAALQDLHDNDEPHYWPAELKAIATEWDLTQ